MAGMVDLDNDHDMDLIFAGDSLCYLNNGSGQFVEGPAIPYQENQDPRCIAFADYDRDGDMDFVITYKLGYAHLIRNDLNEGGHWLHIQLADINNQAGAFGAKTTIYPAGYMGQTLWGFRESRSNNGYLAQNDPVLHFGLDTCTTVDVRVVFLNGTQATRYGVSCNQWVSVSGPDPQLQLRLFLEGPFNPDSGFMHVTLHQKGWLPERSPYEADSRSIHAIPSTTTDWILISLHETIEGPAVTARSGLLQKDGFVVPDGFHETWIPFDVPDGYYYISVSHRNHFHAISSQPVYLSDQQPVSYDFSGAQNRYHGSSGMKELNPGIWGLASGNADSSDQQAFASDLAFIRRGQTDRSEGYWMEDINLDGLIDEVDYQLCRKNMLSGIYSGRLEGP
jgi:hypothetical protein